MFEVLLVEDDEMLRKTIRDMLTGEFSSIEVTEAETGEEAVEHVRLRRPGLIFMDIRLPGKTGLEAMKQVKHLYPHLPVVILTSYDFPEYREAAFRYGAEQFLVKGTTSRQLILSLVAAKLADHGECRDHITTDLNTGMADKTKEDPISNGNESVPIADAGNLNAEVSPERKAKTLNMANSLYISKR